ncbi:MAG: metal-dependent transcriptional regulator [Lachnospiraceae bacterium]|nr:metal-dependent transcriptional regulator [Lachnospiraceae bacterium]
MKLQESGEMYLETIYVLQSKKPFVRSIDIATEMNFSKPSISRAMGILKNNGYLTIAADGKITLTDDGLKIAEKTYERHNVLTAAFVKLGVNPKTAEDDACRVEHVISDETFEAIKKAIQ